MQQLPSLAATEAVNIHHALGGEELSKELVASSAVCEDLRGVHGRPQRLCFSLPFREDLHYQ